MTFLKTALFKENPFRGNINQYYAVLYLLLAFTVAPITPLNAQNPFKSPIKERILTGIEQTIRNDFKGARETYEGLVEDYPEQAFGYFYVGATYQAEMLDREQYDDLPEFRRLMDKTIAISEERRRNQLDYPWELFFEGNAFLYLSFMDNKRSKTWGAYRNAVKGVERLEKVLERDSTFYDALLGVGSYKYWKSSKAKSLTWLPFISDEREKGIAMVQSAIEKGEFVSAVGKDQLAWIYLDGGKGDAALELALDNYNRCPESRFFQWTLVEIYYKTDRREQAYQAYQNMLAEVRAIPGNNHYNEMTCLVRMGEIDLFYKRYRSAEKLLREALALPFEGKLYKRSDKKRKKALELLKKCQKILADLD